MKIKQIKGIKYKQFEEEELREKLGMSEDNIKIVLDYQVKFPQLTICNEDGFCIDGELLCKELGVKDDYNNWLLRTTKGKEGKLIKYRCIENTDFKTDWIFPNANKYSFSNEDMVNMSSQKRSSYGIKNKITLTLKCAKKIAMRQNNNQGDLVCDYFILVESTLKDYEEWEKVRFPEKQNANLLKRELKKWASKNFMDFNDRGVYSREFNMLNKNLCNGKNALDLKLYIGYADKNTRDHLTQETNSAMDYIQKFDIGLIQNNMDFDTRDKMIKVICDTQYKNIGELFK